MSQRGSDSDQLFACAHRYPSPMENCASLRCNGLCKKHLNQAQKHAFQQIICIYSPLYGQAKTWASAESRKTIAVAALINIPPCMLSYHSAQELLLTLEPATLERYQTQESRCALVSQKNARLLFVLSRTVNPKTCSEARS